MKVEKTFIEGLLLIKPDVFEDPRGYFFESFNKNRYNEISIENEFVQDNVSKSSKHTIRGLHYQVGKFAQGKLCMVLQGSVIDVAVDIRFGSPTFGKYFSIELSGKNKNQIWIPPGFAHGFAVTSDNTIFTYKCTRHYNKESERTIIYNDDALSINWQIGNPIVSEKDLKGIPFTDIEKDFRM
ncbi:dTDP-4-dehydrorhamnose 3,5-epimerase [hydrothermal vent metagenome]|uniref:dTDP-4-dehydrorhamnose 3,5-epimerase n=1 Tax=hydrothermal vent metagenome TaxID=652676 RepID=A0A3B1CD22_9ZZZZ